MSKTLLVTLLGSSSKNKTPTHSDDKLNEAIAEHESKIYSLASEASKLRDRLGSLNERVGRSEQFEQIKIEGTQRAQEKYDYHIKNLENDKASLSKRYPKNLNFKIEYCSFRIG